MVDSVFNLGEQLSLTKYLRKDPKDEEVLLINWDATSVRQLNGREMRMIQSSFPILKDI